MTQIDVFSKTLEMQATHELEYAAETRALPTVAPTCRSDRMWFRDSEPKGRVVVCVSRELLPQMVEMLSSKGFDNQVGEMHRIRARDDEHCVFFEAFN